MDAGRPCRGQPGAAAPGGRRDTRRDASRGASVGKLRELAVADRAQMCQELARLLLVDRLQGDARVNEDVVPRTGLGDERDANRPGETAEGDERGLEAAVLGRLFLHDLTGHAETHQ